MRKKRRAVRRPALLAQGQLWKLNHLYVQIVDLTKPLIHYRMLSDVRDTGAKVKTSGAEVLAGYLKSRRAQLVRGH